jgi:hypothetical protein
MKTIQKLIAFTAFVLSGTSSFYAQNNPQFEPSEFTEIRVVGQARVTYYPRENLTRGYVNFYILGKPGEEKDIIQMAVGYKVGGNDENEPESVFITLNTLSKEGLKYNEDHKLTIYLDDELLLSQNTTVLSSSYRPEKLSYQSFHLPTIKYKDFLRMCEAKNIIILLGQTKISLQPDAIQNLRDLDKAVKK